MFCLVNEFYSSGKPRKTIQEFSKDSCCLLSFGQLKCWKKHHHNDSIDTHNKIFAIGKFCLIESK